MQPYCQEHSGFLADRFVEGEYSLCHAPDARGDQCDSCGQLMDPFEPESTENTEAKATEWLINPRCKRDGSKPEKQETKHLFLRFYSLSDKIAAWFKEASKG